MASQRVYALFQDVADAERAIGAMADRGVPRDRIGVAARRPAEAEEAGRVRADLSRQTDGQGAQQGEPVATYEGQPGRLPAAVLAGTVVSTSAVDTPQNVEAVGKGGITTTTPEDAAAGAAVGAGVGLIAGLAAAAAVLIIPGVGPILAGGVLASALGLAAGTTAAGATVGGVVGYLRDMGMPEQAATHYADRLTEGDYLVTAVIDSADYDHIKQLLLKYHAAGVDTDGVNAGAGVMRAVEDTPAVAAGVQDSFSPSVTASVGTRIVTQDLDGTPIIPARIISAE